MSEVDTLKEKLVRMPRRAYGELLRQVEAERREELEKQEAKHPLRAGMTRDDFALWVARHHYEVDPGLTRILYLPTGAPPDEVRLLECNEIAPLPEDGPLYASPYAVDLEEVNYRVIVADASPAQFDGVLSGRYPLPDGWVLDGHREFRFVH